MLNVFCPAFLLASPPTRKHTYHISIELFKTLVYLLFNIGHRDGRGFLFFVFQFYGQHCTEPSLRLSPTPLKHSDRNGEPAQGTDVGFGLQSCLVRLRSFRRICTNSQYDQVIYMTESKVAGDFLLSAFAVPVISFGFGGCAGPALATLGCGVVGICKTSVPGYSIGVWGLAVVVLVGVAAAVDFGVTGGFVLSVAGGICSAKSCESSGDMLSLMICCVPFEDSRDRWIASFVSIC